jgi:hypothetical protein
MPDMPKNIETVLNPKKTSGSDNGVRTDSLETVADIKISDGPPMINSETPCFVGAFYLMLVAIWEYRGSPRQAECNDY